METLDSAVPDNVVNAEKPFTENPYSQLDPNQDGKFTLHALTCNLTEQGRQHFDLIVAQHQEIIDEREYKGIFYENNGTIIIYDALGHSARIVQPHNQTDITQYDKDRDIAALLANYFYTQVLIPVRPDIIHAKFQAMLNTKDRTVIK